MHIANLFQLSLLAAIWGGSFLLMRVSAISLSPATMIESRVFLAAFFILVVAQLVKKQLPIRQHWKHLLILGLFNSAIPFLLLAWSAQTLTASMMSVLNATSPIWGMLTGLLCRHSTITLKSVLGLATGIAGVLILVGMGDVIALDAAPAAIMAALGAAVSYGIASNYTHSAKTTVSSFDNAHGSMWAASLLILPTLPFSPSHNGVDTGYFCRPFVRCYMYWCCLLTLLSASRCSWRTFRTDCNLYGPCFRYSVGALNTERAH